ncbi:tRNA pseudouridine(55) synthase TruB [Oscillatoria sp. FACHB-1407]|uniref:tRNA pseudouridine(55) synthase TruB n=1 Tax=Oscillatoria sp. FACHB-1407 TaxID=2692847 RepID=UPI0016882879|nr:tRNA pseudouridine(55) synthase TruB [Oscillatoria sp. FACHB-1407]MBD2461457.1 tRNA pseudouridine(55) synthase TruB [Oscillatoria sp. FACHB-1407]
MDGFLNLNKPAGLTSHDCVAKVRKLLRLKRVGHGGTLDPAATGVLPIALGRATRLLQYLPSGKAYQATIRFGMTTTTDDLEGEVLTKTPAPELNLDTVKALLPQFLGTIQQIPPSYSAIQVQGKRLYDLARSGQVVEAPVRTVEVYDIEILEWRSGEFPELVVAIACGAGTYIRSIARDWGALLNTGGTLAALIRTESSGFQLKDSLTLETLAEQIQAHTFQPIPPAIALSHLPTISLDEAQTKRWCQGQRIELSEAIDSATDIFQVRQGDRFLGIGKLITLETVPHVVPQLVFASDEKG